MDEQSAPRLLFAPRELPPLGPDAAHDADRYAEWCRQDEVRMRRRDGPADLGANETALVLLVLETATAPAPSLVARSLTSLAAQTHPHWLLSLVVVGDPSPALAEALGGPLADLGDRALRRDVTATTSVSEALNAALERASGPTDGDPAVLVLWPGDELAPDALHLLLARLHASAATLVYADEDRVDDAGTRHTPVLKPDWSGDLLLAAPYLGRAYAVRRRALQAAGGFAPAPGGCAGHHLQLRLSDGLERVPHVARVLYHRRAAPVAPLWSAPDGPAAVTAALTRRGEVADVEPGPLPGSWSLRRRVPPGVTTTVIVPFRDQAPLLRACVDTVRATAAGVELELLLVDNGSCDPETRSLVDRLAASPDVHVHRDDRPFNWAALNNHAAARASGEVLVFLNNDVECRRPGWLAALAAQALRPDVGAVGARLLYPDQRVQHAGVVLGLGGAAGHVLSGLPAEEPGYLGMAVLTRDCSAVTGACLATRRDVFTGLRGFDESLGLDLNDIDYCLRARQQGRRIVYEPRAELVHFESPSRGTSGSIADITRFIDRWEQEILAGDPHLNPNLTRVDCSCALRGLGERRWWQEWRSSLQGS